MSVSQNYSKLPVVIQAIVWEGTLSSTIAVLSFMNRVYSEKAYENIHEAALGKGFLAIETLEGVMAASIGDYIIRGVKGEYYPCKPDIFKATYIEENTPPRNMFTLDVTDAPAEVQDQIAVLKSLVTSSQNILGRLEAERAEVLGRIERASVACANHELDPEKSKLPQYHYEIISGEQLEGMRIYEQALEKRIINIRAALA